MRTLTRTLSWVVVFISCSVLLTLIFCPNNYISLFYHIYYFPIYFISGYAILWMAQKINSSFKSKTLGLLTFWMLIILLSLFLRDGPMQIRNFSIEEFISNGCRELFYFSSLIISSILIFSFWRKSLLKID